MEGIPQVETKTIDLEPYGIKGELKVRGTNKMIAMAIADKLKSLARKDGVIITDKTPDEKVQQIATEYQYALMLFTMRKCIISYPGSNGEEIPEKVIECMTDELQEEIASAIKSLDKFPLPEGLGKGHSKSKEQ